MTGQAIEGAAVATSFQLRSPARQTAWIAAILFAILAVLVLPPLWFLLQSSLVVQQGRNVTEFGLGNFATVLSSRQFLSNSANSLIFAAGSATMALIVGWVTAW